MLDAFIQAHQLPAAFRLTAEQYYVPIANKIHQQVGSRPFFLGINVSLVTREIQPCFTTGYYRGELGVSIHWFKTQLRSNKW